MGGDEQQPGLSEVDALSPEAKRAWARVYAGCSKVLFRHFFRLTGDSRIAAEYVHDAFVRAFEIEMPPDLRPHFLNYEEDRQAAAGDDVPGAAVARPAGVAPVTTEGAAGRRAVHNW